MYNLISGNIAVFIQMFSLCDDLTSELTHNIRNMGSFRDKCKCTRKGHLKGSFLEMGNN